MSNKYITDIVELIKRPLDDLELGGCDLVEIRINVSRKEITGSIRTGVRTKGKEEEEEQH